MTNPTALIHLYRGELGRLTAYRIRLDTTSNWALGATVAIVTFVLGDVRVHHAVFLLPAVLTAVFALIEARRLQDLELIRARVRLIEQGFFAAELGGRAPEDWERRLSESLAEPTAPITLWHALAARLQRNHGWIFVTIYGAWWLKILTTPDVTLGTAAHVGPIPGMVAIGIATVGVLGVAVVAATARPVLPG